MIGLVYAAYFTLVALLIGIVIGVHLQKWHSDQIIAIQRQRIAFFRRLLGWDQ